MSSCEILQSVDVKICSLFKASDRTTRHVELVRDHFN